MPDSEPHLFGGGWTERKLEVLRKYLSAYTTALKKTPFQKCYIDAFAGTGYRTIAGPSGSHSEDSCFPELASPEAIEFRDGSAKIALKTDPPFDAFLFIEADGKRRAELERLKAEHSGRTIDIMEGDANAVLREICQPKKWKDCRAVLFLDPYGMQVEWATIEAIASTKAIDMWYLFPSGIGVNRLVASDPAAVTDGWAARLTKLFGTDEWRTRFYAQSTTQGVFEDLTTTEKIVNTEDIAAYFGERLRTLFPGVAVHPGRLTNSTGSTLYHLFFAAANPKGAPIATKIAEHLLKGL